MFLENKCTLVLSTHTMNSLREECVLQHETSCKVDNLKKTLRNIDRYV